MKHKAKALVLKNTKYKEADLLVHLLTSKGESLCLRAPSALKSKKRFYPGTLEPTHYIALTYKSPSRPHWPLLLEAQVLEDFAPLRQNFKRLQTALHFVHLVEKVSRTGVDLGVAIFNLLGHALRLAQHSSCLDVLRLQFEVKFLYLQGVLDAKNHSGNDNSDGRDNSGGGDNNDGRDNQDGRAEVGSHKGSLLSSFCSGAQHMDHLLAAPLAEHENLQALTYDLQNQLSVQIKEYVGLK